MADRLTTPQLDAAKRRLAFWIDFAAQGRSDTLKNDVAVTVEQIWEAAVATAKADLEPRLRAIEEKLDVLPNPSRWVKTASEKSCQCGLCGEFFFWTDGFGRKQHEKICG